MQEFRFDPYAAAVDADPYPLYRTLRDRYPCFWSEDANCWVLSRHADILATLNDWKTFSSAQGNLVDELPDRAGATLGTTDPPRHDRLRALISHAFMKRNIESLQEPIRSAVRQRLDRLGSAREFDFIADFSSYVTTDVLFRLLGLPPGDDKAVREKAVLMVQTDPHSRRKGPEHVAAYEWMQDYAAAIIAARRRDPGDDLMSQFVHAEISGQRLQEREVLMTTTTLIMAGIESLGGFMAMFGFNLAEFQESRRALAADPARIADAIEESLRFNTSAQRFRRCATRDVEIHGRKIRAGQFVMLAFGSANRDERQFPDPDRYDINRRPRGHLGFGGGVHFCLGAMIARLAVRITFEEFLRRYPVFSRAQQPLQWIPSTTFRSPMSLGIEVAAR
ncbi:MAG: cytochrome P450 [Sinobacteraceae bacterium]|nr:cytochrome P450 [Nevskiaceae bacterium]